MISGRFAVPWTLATAAMAALCVALTEFASAFHRLTAGSCALGWAAADVLVLACAARAAGGWRPALDAFRHGFRPALFRSASPAARALAWTTLVLVLILGVFSLATPTTVWDCQTFHMPRVMHWLQNRGVSNYATNIPRQLEYPPGVEMAIAQLVLLAGTDLPANLPQWWALVTCAILAAFFAREFLAGAPFRNGAVSSSGSDFAAAAAALLVLVAPDAAPQAMSSLCDLAATAWVLAALAFGWLLFNEPRNIVYSLGVAVATALATAAKLTVGLYLAPFFALLGAFLVWRRCFGATAKAAVLGCLLVGCINGPWMTRNWSLVRNLAGSPQSFALNTAPALSFRGVAANLARNASLYTRTPFRPLTARLNSLLGLGMALVNEDPADPQWTFSNYGFEFPGPSRLADGDGLGNWWPAVFFLGAMGGLLARSQARSLAVIYLTTLAGSFVLFSSVLRWDPWHDRLEMTYFILAAPLAAAGLSVALRTGVTIACLTFLALNAALTVCVNPTYPAFAALLRTRPRDALYFAVRPELYEPTAALADDIVRARCENVLLKIGDDTWEYPLWALLKDRGFSGSIHHVLVDNESAHCPGGSWSWPDSVILTMHSGHPAIPPAFGLQVTYDPWRSWWRGDVEERARLVAGRGVLKYTFSQPGDLDVRFEPRDIDQHPIASGLLSVTIKAIETNRFQTIAELASNVPLSSVTSFSCPVLAPSVTILLTNRTPQNHLAVLARLSAVERVRAPH